MKNITLGRIVLSVVSAALMILFVFWSYYQFNDQDSFRWVMVYGVAAAICLLSMLNRLPAFLPAILGGVSLLWAAYLSTQITYDSPLITIEEWREMMGLLVVVASMGVLAWANRSKKQTMITREAVLANPGSDGTADLK